MSSIFISYRRGRTSDITCRIHERLTTHFGAHKVYLDIDSIPLGVRFPDHLAKTLDACEVVIAVIGDDWRPDRLGDENDVLRQELEFAIERDVTLIPVLVHGVPFPAASELPNSLFPLLEFQAHRVDSGRDFGNNIQQLITGIERSLRQAEAARTRLAEEMAEQERGARDMAERASRRGSVPEPVWEAAHSSVEGLRLGATHELFDLLPNDKTGSVGKLLLELARDPSDRVAAYARSGLAVGAYGAKSPQGAGERAPSVPQANAHSQSYGEPVGAGFAGSERREVSHAPPSADQLAGLRPHRRAVLTASIIGVAGIVSMSAWLSECDPKRFSGRDRGSDVAASGGTPAGGSNSAVGGTASSGGSAGSGDMAGSGGMTGRGGTAGGGGTTGRGGMTGRGGTAAAGTAAGRGGKGTSAPKVRMGATTVSGRLPSDIIQRIVRQNYGRFRMCYEQGLARNPNLKGRVAARFVIGRDGSVSNVGNAGSDLPDSGVVGCVLSAFYGLSFPKPEGGVVTVVYPLLLSPAEPAN